MSDNYRTRQEKRALQEKRQEKKQEKNVKKKSTARKIVKRMIAFIILFGFLGVLAVGITAFAFIMDAPKLDVAALESPQSTRIYDRNIDLIAELGNEKRTNITHNQIPQILEDAVLATEDVRFYDHFGIDLQRIGGAILANVTNGFGSQGASTITQQVVKLSYLSSEKTMKRKVQEQWLAIQLDAQFSKQQILTMYLNKINYGNRSYGVAKASETYFGKDLKDLTLPEAALLAGLPQRPAGYDPYKYPDLAEQRRNTVLSLMEKHGKITRQQAEEAKATHVVDYIVKKEEKSNPYDAFVDQVLEELEQIEDLDVLSSGVSVYTTIDVEAQKLVEKALNTNDYIKYPDDRFQAGLVVLDTKNGEILAIGGGRHQSTSYYGTDIKRQPGSTAKPIFDYGPAIENFQWSTYHQIVDEPHSYTKGPAVKNWDGRYKGQMSIREALADSRNIPALKTFQEVGPAKSRAFAVKLGVKVEDTIHESYSIGGFNGMSPLDQAGAYSAFGNNGIYTKPHTIRKVVFPDGREINMKPEPVAAMKDYTAFMITDMLKTVVQSGTGRSANVPGVHIAGKTGSTNFDDKTRAKYGIPKGGMPDVWFTGYSPDYTISVWTGYNEHGKNNYISSSSSGIAKQLFKVVMSGVTKGKTQSDFVTPNSVVRVPVVKGSNPPKMPSVLTPDSQIVYEYFVKGTEPTEVSDQFDKIPSVQNVETTFNRDENKIVLKWQYDENLLERVSFVVNAAMNQSDYIPYWSGKEMSVTISDPYPDTTYRFEIIAIDDQNPESKSDAIQVSIETKLFDSIVPENPMNPEQPTEPRGPGLPGNESNQREDRNRNPTRNPDFDNNGNVEDNHGDEVLNDFNQ
ncbi:MAG TPA: PBP1A family penicillin-binding protein [Bacillus bacterium]|nr:PBP1A family penicillin-binding protein [Bacillus sp. (in: firmicutes)]